MPWWARLHHALMPDYNRQASVYWWTMVLGGGALLLACLVRLASQEPLVWLHVAVGTALAMLAGLFPVRIPGTRHSFVASDVFIFLLLLLHGPAAAAVAVAGEAVMGSMRTSKRWTSRIASPAIGTVAIVLAGSLLEALRLRLGLQGGGPEQTVGLMALAMGTALLYFLLSATLFAGVLRLKRNEAFFQVGDVVSVFRWVGMAYAGSAAFATLLLTVHAAAGAGVWMVMLPLLALLLLALHFYFRQQEATRALQERSVEAEAREAQARQREAEAGARHLHDLQASERRFLGAFTHAAIGMALLAFDGRVLQGNAALSALLGRGAAEMTGHRLHGFMHPEHLAALDLRLAEAGRGHFDDSPVELRFVRPDGSTPWAAMHFAAFTETESGEPCIIVQAQDITGRRVAEEQLQHLAFHDTLTGLPNRRRFMQCLEGAVARSRADGSYAYAVMFLDFDRFKTINDTLGHGAGDELLAIGAKRLRNCVRPSDLVARLGGDEFAILLHSVRSDQNVIELAERIQASVQEPLAIGGKDVRTSASIGITTSAWCYRVPEDVLRDADIAMYAAKEQGRARYAVFDRDGQRAPALHAEGGWERR